MSAKHLLIFCFPLLLSQLFSACGTANDIEGIDVDVHYTSLQKGILYGGGAEEISEGISVVKNMEELQALLLKINSVNHTVSENLVSDVHYFDQKMMLFIFDKVRGSGGHLMTIQRVFRSNDELVVEVLNVPPDGPATTVMTQPFEIIELNRSDLPVVVRFI
jgi:hypothetical protein